jgi:hypothetical protein
VKTYSLVSVGYQRGTVCSDQIPYALVDEVSDFTWQFEEPAFGVAGLHLIFVHVTLFAQW